MFNKLCLYERGNFTEPEMCSLWQKTSISYYSCRYSFVIASVGFIIDRVTTQHTPKCVENVCFFYKENLLTYKNLQKYATKYIHIYNYPLITP